MTFKMDGVVFAQLSVQFIPCRSRSGSFNVEFGGELPLVDVRAMCGVLRDGAAGALLAVFAAEG